MRNRKSVQSGKRMLGIIASISLALAAIVTLAERGTLIDFVGWAFLIAGCIIVVVAPILIHKLSGREL